LTALSIAVSQFVFFRADLSSRGGGGGSDYGCSGIIAEERRSECFFTGFCPSII